MDIFFSFFFLTEYEWNSAFRLRSSSCDLIFLILSKKGIFRKVRERYTTLRRRVTSVSGNLHVSRNRHGGKEPWRRGVRGAKHERNE